MTLADVAIRRIRRTASLVRMLSAREFRSRYRHSVLEMAWSLITPVVLMVVYGVILTQVFAVESGGVPYLSLVWTGMVVWMMFSSAVGNGVRSIIGNADLVSKVYFPREALPLAVVGSSFFDLAIGTAVLVPVVAVQITDVGWSALAAVPILAVVVLWTATLTVFLAAVAVFIRDVAHAVTLLLQVGFFVSPVMYPADAVPDRLRALTSLNPIAVCIDALREATLFHRWPDWGLLGVHAAVAVVALLSAIAYVAVIEDRMVDVV